MSLQLLCVMLITNNEYNRKKKIRRNIIKGTKKNKTKLKKLSKEKKEPCQWQTTPQTAWQQWNPMNTSQC